MPSTVQCGAKLAAPTRYSRWASGDRRHAKKCSREKDTRWGLAEHNCAPNQPLPALCSCKDGNVMRVTPNTGASLQLRSAVTSRRAWALVGMTSMSLLYFYFTLFCSVRLPACLWRFWFTCAVTATSCGPRQGTLLSQGVWPRQLRTASTNRCAHRFLSRESLSHIYCLCCAAKCAR